MYFNKTPVKWINDVLSQDVHAKDTMVDMTEEVKKLIPESITELENYGSVFRTPRKKKLLNLSVVAKTRSPKYNCFANS